MGNNRSRYFLWIVAGIYVGYLGYSLISGYMKGDSDNMLLCVGVGILFIVAGIALVVMGIRNVQRLSTESSGEETSVEETSDEADGILEDASSEADAQSTLEEKQLQADSDEEAAENEEKQQ